MISSFPEDGTPVPKHVMMILIVNCVLWFVLYCIVLYCTVLCCIKCICWSIYWLYENALCE